MNVHVHESLGGPVRAAMQQVLNLFAGESTYKLVERAEDADVVILQGTRTLESAHSYERQYLLFPNFREAKPAAAPDNVQVLDQPINPVQCLEALNKAKERTGGQQASQATAEKPDAPRVLVIDDSERHCAAAREQLTANYNLTVVTNYSQALKAIQQPYDAVLTDLMLPASSETLGTEAIEKYVGQEMPLGFVIALLAAQAGCQRIAVVTDLNHHQHPMSAALDHLTKPFQINGAKVIFTNRYGGDGKPWQTVLEELLKDE